MPYSIPCCLLPPRRSRGQSSLDLSLHTLDCPINLFHDMILMSEGAKKKRSSREEKQQRRRGLRHLRCPPLEGAMPLLRRLPLRAEWFLSCHVSGCLSLGTLSHLRALWILSCLVSGCPSTENFSHQNSILPGLPCLRIPFHLSRNTSTFSF